MLKDFETDIYYCKSTWEVEKVLARAIEVLDSFEPEKLPEDINHILELYDIKLLIQGKTRHSKFIDTSKYTDYERPLMACVVSFYEKIDKNNIKEYSDDCRREFKNTFWDLIVELKVYKRIDRFPWVAGSCGMFLYTILQYKEVVNDIDDEMSQYMRDSDQTPRILIDYYLRKGTDKRKLCIPKGFSSKDKKDCVLKYLSSDDINANLLTLIIEAPKNIQEFPVDDRMKIMAENRIRDIYDGKTHNVVIHNQPTQFIVSFQDGISEMVERHFDNGSIELIYDVSWIKDNLDYPTLLNNFIYLFNYVDLSMRWQLTEKASYRGAIEDSILVKGIKSYIAGGKFKKSNVLATLQMACYYDELSKQGVALEDVIKWFFESYLKEEFSASGFVCNVPQTTESYLAKCKLMLSAMDGVAKQYRMYLEDGFIDRKLYERSSEHMKYEKLGSLQSCKYVYCMDERLLNAQMLLFSDQSNIAYTTKTKSNYDTFIKMISEEDMYKSDFSDWQWQEIEKLIALNAVSVEKNVIRQNHEVINLLYELYNQEVICYQYWKNDILDEWIKESLVDVGSTLFSRGESAYINYMLNQSEYSNGKDLRNKYIHDSCPQDEEIQRDDYFEILKIMILMIIKINEEFCLKDYMDY